MDENEKRDSPRTVAQDHNFNHGYGSYDYRSYSHMGEALIGGFEGRGPKGYQRSDESILEDVCEMLTAHAEIDASEMEVHVESGIVTLKGTVPDRPMKRLVDAEVERISGVIDIKDELEVRPEGALSRIARNIGFGDPAAAPLVEENPGANLRDRSSPKSPFRKTRPTATRASRRS